MSDEKQVVVIGAGIAGMSTAALLAKRGVRCVALEKSSRPGGRASWVERNGFIIDFGIHVNRYAEQGRAAEVLRALGETPRFVPTGQPVLYTENGFTPLPKGPVKILTTPLLSFRSRLRLLGMFVSILRRKNLDELYGMSVDQWLAAMKLDQPDILDLVRVLSASGLVCPETDQACAAELVHFLKGALKARHATGYLLGGWPGLFRRLEAAVNANGEVLYNTKAEEIIVEEGLAVGVRAGGRVIPADAVVSTVPIQETASVLPEHFIPESLRESLKKIEPTCGISYDVCLKTRVSDLDGVMLTLDPATMGLFTSNVEPSTAPRGKQLLTWFYPIPLDMMDNRDFLKGEKRRMRELIERMFPGFADAVEYERWLELRLVDGAVPRVGQTHRDRPAVDFPILPNVFIAGDGVGEPGHGGDVAFASALRAAELAAKRLGK